MNIFKRVYACFDQENNKLNKICEILIIFACVVVSLLMFKRAFYGVEITDESYYISDAIQMIKGNLTYVYNNYSYGTGSAFLIIPFVYIYGLFCPRNEGVVLYTRICYLIFWFICLWLAYRVLKKNFKRKNALLITCFFDARTSSLGIGCFML